MALRPHYPCRQYGCKALVSPPGFCEAHKKQRTGWFKTSTQTQTERGYGWAWFKLRNSIMMRDGGLCQVCMASKRVTKATEVDHITPKSRGGLDDPGNLQAICKRCHQIKTQLDKG